MSDIKKYGIDWNKGILNDGSFRRLKRVMKKAQAEIVCINAGIGGTTSEFGAARADSIHITTLAEHIEYRKHVIEIRIIKTHENDQVPFYLVSVIGA